MRFSPVYPPVLALIATTAISLSSSAGDWPQWRGPNRTGHVPAALRTPTTLPLQPLILWRQKLGDGLSSPIFVQNKVFLLDNDNGQETLHAFDATTGTKVWSMAIDEAFRDTQSPAGPRSTPIADVGRIFVQSCRGELQCRNIEDGKLIWRTNYVSGFDSAFIGEKGKAAGASRHGYNGSPLIDGEKLIALVGSTNGAGVVAFNKATGAVVWQTTDEPAAYAAPLLTMLAGQKQVVAFMAESLIGIDPVAGKLLWRVPLKTSLGRHATTPVVIDDLVLVASHELGLVAIKVIRQDGQFKAEQAWASKDAAFNFSSPVAVGKHLYGLGSQKNLVCVDSATGQIAWSKDGYISSAPTKAYASFLVFGQNILALTDGGELLLMAADPAEFREISRVQICGANWCYPAYADGKLYLRDARELLCGNLLPEP